MATLPCWYVQILFSVSSGNEYMLTTPQVALCAALSVSSLHTHQHTPSISKRHVCIHSCVCVMHLCVQNHLCINTHGSQSCQEAAMSLDTLCILSELL